MQCFIFCGEAVDSRAEDLRAFVGLFLLLPACLLAAELSVGNLDTWSLTENDLLLGAVFVSAGGAS